MEWISTKDRLPENDTPLLIWYIDNCGFGIWEEGLLSCGQWKSADLDVIEGDVTHWAEIKPPKEYENT